MAHGSQSVRVTEGDGWSRLLDPKLFAFVVVGAGRVDQIDPSWPRVGAALGYSFGNGLFRRRGDVHVRSRDPNRHRIEVELHGWEPTTFIISIALRRETGRTRADIEVVAPMEGSTTTVEVLRLLTEQRCRGILQRVPSLTCQGS